MKTLARTNKLNHKIGDPLETPLLIPSFSSKGLGFVSKNEKMGFQDSDKLQKVSMANQIMGTVSEVITDTMLVSAFDMAQGFIPEPDSLIINPALTFVDSGGYETTNYYDFSDLFMGPQYKNDWTPETHMSFLKLWSEYKPAVFVSFDQNIPLNQQINNALKLFNRYPNQLNDFLIKPERSDNKLVPIDAIRSSINELKHFDIIGVTEKELGSTVLDRMINIATLRQIMDKAGIICPIHIFGSLDPISTCLYFLSGAEIFDGLTWSRFSYLNGQAVYKPNYGSLSIGIHESDDKIQAKSLFDNLYYLKKLQASMREFAVTGNFNVFPHNSSFLKESYATLISKIK